MLALVFYTREPIDNRACVSPLVGVSLGSDAAVNPDKYLLADQP